ncbi:unnamed protein product [Effrenium voratum]|uniref:Uncharacterized protein n=1 Tax=Effrenium voratum TaxID=2562239 RepID=A0AA36MLJ5_9DINO|nr:unnamed protein product [Effrenium voratum]
MQKDAQRHLAINVQEMLYGEEDALWEFFCAPDSWLTFAAERDGLKSMRVNLANNMDLYRPDTYQVLEKLAATKRPRRLWVSMPCTKWSSWARLNYHDRPEQLTKFRRRERKMMRLFANWLSKTLESGQRPEYYHEWPTHCDGWNVQEMGQIQRILEYFGYRVFWCRIDGCRYNLRSRDGKQLLRKQWTIMPTDERFYAMFRSKTCVGGHDHGEIAGVETASTAYYPWNLCRSIARLWRQQEVPDRVLKKLWIKEAIDITDEKYLEMVLHAAEAEPDAEEGEAVEDVREEEAVGGAEPTEAEKQEMRNQTNPMEWKSLTDLIPSKEYVDVIHEEPDENDEEKVDLPTQPDASTIKPVTSRRLRFKQPEPTTSVEDKQQSMDINDYQPRSAQVDVDADLEEDDLGIGDGRTFSVGEKRQKVSHGEDDSESPDMKDEEAMRAEFFDALDEVNEGYVMELDLDFQLNSYRHIGVDVNVIDKGDEFFVELEQTHYAETLEDLAIDSKRLRSSGDMTAREVSMCRGALGALQWLAVQSAPLICARCNLLLTDLSEQPTLATAKEVQDLIKEARTMTSTTLRFHHFNDVEHWQDMTVIGMADQLKFDPNFIVSAKKNAKAGNSAMDHMRKGSGKAN